MFAHFLLLIYLLFFVFKIIIFNILKKKMSSSNPDGNPYEYDLYGSRYLYLNTRKNLYNDYKGTIQRAISSINPFAMPSIPN